MASKPFQWEFTPWEAAHAVDRFRTDRCVGVGERHSCVTIMYQLRARVCSENCTFGPRWCVNIKLSYMKMSLDDTI